MEFFIVIALIAVLAMFFYLSIGWKLHIAKELQTIRSLLEKIVRRKDNGKDTGE